MKKLLTILKNPSPDTNFLNEIHNKDFKTKRVTKKYLKSFSQERRAIKNTGIFLNIILAIFIIICLTLIIHALLIPKDTTALISEQFYATLNK